MIRQWWERLIEKLFARHSRDFSVSEQAFDRVARLRQEIYGNK